MIDILLICPITWGLCWSPAPTH